MAGEGRGGHGSPNRRIFGNVYASSENLRTFVIGKDNGFEFYREIIELDPPYCTGATAPQVPT